LALAFFPKDNKNAMRRFTFAITALVFIVTVWMALPRKERLRRALICARQQFRRCRTCFRSLGSSRSTSIT
jgi:hypothetical protein